MVLSHRMWGHLTCPQAWLTASAASPLQPCPTYRKLYQLLRQWQQLQGVWRINDCSRVLVVFSWAPDCITATRLTYGDQEAATLEPQASPLLCVGPAHSNTLVDLYGAQHCSISVTQGGSPSSAKFDAAVEAAAAVAVGSIPIPGRRESSGGSPLGGSPQGSFEYEMMRFMQGNVAGSKGKRRRSGRGQRASQKGIHIEQKQYCLTRVERPLPTLRHPLSGLWKGLEHDGVTIVHICYDFTGPSARIIASKIGDLQLLPASSLGRQRACEWQAAAASLSDPLSAQELLLISLRGHLTIAGLRDVTEEADTLKEVALCYQGKGSCAWTMGYPSTSCEGRLWQYSDGTLGFLWIHPVHGERIVDYARLDGDLELARH